MIRSFCPARGIAVAALMTLLAGSAGCSLARAQVASVATAAGELPDNPRPAVSVDEQAQSSSQAQTTAPQDSAAGSSKDQKVDEREKARQQLEQQKAQRVLGVVPMFNTSYVSDAVSLTAGEKIKMAFRSSIDPVSFAGAAVVAGLGEISPPANNNGFGWGAEGYFKKWGAAYLDTFNGTMIGNGFLPAILRQDPRYFRLGRGTTTKRTLYATSMIAVCRHDNSRKLEPNYSNVGGNFAAGALSTLYYPSGGERQGAEQVVTSALIVTAQGALGNIFQEFWPDISRKLFHKDPTHGLDDQMKAAEKQHGEPAKESDKPKQPLPQSPK